MLPTLKYWEKKNCFDQDSLALAIFWISVAEVTIL